MVDYVSLAAVAKRLIDANGRDLTIRKKDRVPADSNKPWRAGGTSDTDVGPLKGVLVPYESKDVDGTLVRREDKRALIAANDTNPDLIEQFDSVVDGSDVWRIVSVETLNPGDVRLIYTLQLRR